MRSHPVQARGIGLKALYFLSLAALCVYIVNGPARAGTIASGSYTFANVNEPLGSLVDSSPGYIAQKGPNLVALEYLNLNCFGYCFVQESFGFAWTDYVGDQVDITITLTGVNYSPTAYGNIMISGWGLRDWRTNPDSTLSMTPIHYSVAADGSPVWISGTFNYWAPSGGIVRWEGTSLDFQLDDEGSVPEPGSALLFVAGLSMVEFLRRKSRR